MAKKNPRSGTTLEDMFREEGNYEEIKNAAIKSVLAHKLEEAMKAQNLSKTGMAKQMDTSRAQINRLLDPDNDSVTLNTLQKAAAVLGMRLELELHLP